MPSTVCTGVTKRGKACRNMTSSPCGKCHCHREGVVRGPFNLGKPRCGAPTLKGSPCKCLKMKGGKFCGTHTYFAELYGNHTVFPMYDGLKPTEDLRDDAEYVRENVPPMVQNARWFLYEELKDSVDKRYRELEAEYKRVLMASRIKRYFTRSIASPEYRLCRDRLTREFNESPTI